MIRNTLIMLLSALLFSAQVYGTQERRTEGNRVIKGIPEEIPQSLRDRLQQYQNTRGHAFRSWAPDGEGIFIGTRFGETSQVHHLRGAGAARRQITFFDEPARGASVNHHSGHNGFIFSMDLEGDERNQYYYFDMESAEYNLLSDGKNIHRSLSWDRDGDYIYYSSNRRNGTDFDIYKAPFDNPEDYEMIYEGEGAWYNGDISPDNDKMLIGRYISNEESYYYVMDLETAVVRQVNPVDQNVSYGHARFNKDGSGLFLVSDQESEYKRLHYYDLETQEKSVITGDIDWDIEDVSMTKERDRVAFLVNEEGMSQLYLMDPETKEYELVESIPVGIATSMGFHPDGHKLALTLNTPRSPSDVYVLDLETHALDQWTFAEIGGLNPDRFIEPQVIHYPTFDKVDDEPRMIPSFYYQPEESEGPYPVVIDIHGGPAAQYRPYFRSTAQFMLNEEGIAVLGPNVRGSTGYGKTYVTLDDEKKREHSVKDIGALLDWIEENPDLDENRVAVMGGSYGGYMVYASLIHYGDRIRCGVSSVGIANFVTFLENTGDYRRDLRRVEYGDERDPEMRAFLKDISPTTHADKIQSPTFIMQGANDPRVPASEAELMLESIQDNDIDVWYLLAKDEGHGFRRKTNRDYATEARMLFFRKYLLGNE